MTTFIVIFAIVGSIVCAALFVKFAMDVNKQQQDDEDTGDWY